MNNHDHDHDIISVGDIGEEFKILRKDFEKYKDLVKTIRNINFIKNLLMFLFGLVVGVLISL